MAQKYMTKITALLMAVAVSLCLGAMFFPERIAEAFGGPEIGRAHV